MRLVVHCRDNEVLVLNAEPQETLVDAAARQGITWPVDCREGVCGACKVKVISGKLDMEFYTDEAITSEELAAGYALGCQSKPLTDVVVKLRAVSSRLRSAAPRIFASQVTRIDAVAKDTVHLMLRMDKALDFLPGQYAKLKVPGTNSWRSFSFTSIPQNPEVSFLIRILPQGVMSDYLRQAKVGDAMELSGPYGVFYHRPEEPRSVFIAGGTGLGPMLSMLQTLAHMDRGATHVVHLLYGVNDVREVACGDILDAVARKLPAFSSTISIVHSDQAGIYRCGYVTDLLDDLEQEQNGATFYLCGPPPMIEAGRKKLSEWKVDEDRIVYEKFIPSN